MKVSLKLLQSFGEVNQPLDDLIRLVAARIGEVESTVDLSKRYEKILIAEITEAKPHPDADKLGVYQIDNGISKFQVVAGDKTLEPGDLVAHIPPGTIVPATIDSAEPLEISERELRGELSQGMLASGAELGFNNDHSRVLKLDAGQKGQSLTEVYELDDHILDIEAKVLTHRPDMFGHLGFARELHGVVGQAFASPDWWLKSGQIQPEAELDLKLEVSIPEAVARYSAVVYQGVEVKPSPIQIQSWLSRLGVRPVNNVVDLTNYLMLLTGQPLHAFDYDKLVKVGGGAKIIVRRAERGETLTLLDGAKAELHPDDIVIAGADAPLALGGMMGGLDTEVDETTTRVVMEAANFDMYSIRNSSMRHGLFSEAVTRFARGQDPEAITPVQVRAVELMEQWAGAKPASGLIDNYPSPGIRPTVKAEVGRISRLLGAEYDTQSILKCLQNVEFEADAADQLISITPPSWRPDINIEEDIAEEIGRMNGYDRIEPSLPRRSLKPSNRTPLDQFSRDLGRKLAAAGANELLTYSGVSRRLLEIAGQDQKQAFAIRNAISPDLHHMRLSLMPSLLEKVRPNLKRGHQRFVLFEAGVTHHKALMEGELPVEQPALALVHVEADKAASPGAPYYQAKHYLDYLFSSLNMTVSYRSLSERDPWLQAAVAPLDTTRRAAVVYQDQEVGVIGEISQSTASALKLPAQTAAFELHLGRLLDQYQPQSAYHPLSRYPHVLVDLTLKVPESCSYSEVKELVDSFSAHGVRMLSRPLSIYQKDQRTRNLSFRLDFVSIERTLTQAEVNAWLEEVAASAKDKLGAEIV